MFKCFVKMKNIITLEEIYEIDTITLEEKLQELQDHPTSYVIQNLISLVKLELVQRQKVQAFGRKLIQEKQQQKQLDNNWPQIQDIAVKNVSTLRFSEHQQIHGQNSMKTIKSQTSRKNNLPKVPAGLLQKLKLSTMSSSNYVVIGKPSINHRYVPIKKKQPSKQKKINTKKMQIKPKKQTQSMSRMKVITNQIKKQNNKSSEEITSNLIDLQIKIPVQIRRHLQKQEIKVENIQQNNAKQQQKLQTYKQPKHQQKKQIIELKFVQNDIYDQEQQNQIFQQPQNLKQIQNMIDIETQTTINDHNTQILYQKCEDSQQQIKNSVFYKNQQSQVTKSCKKTEQFQQQKQFQIKDYDKEEKYFLNKAQQNMQTSQIQFQNIENIKKQQETLKNRSNSFKIIKKINNNYFKQTVQTSKNENLSTNRSQINFEKRKKESFNLKKQEKVLKPIETQRKIILQPLKKQPVNFTKTNFLYSPLITQQIFSYHQLIPNFSKLFPHSKNILMTLKNFQNNIKSHFQKNVFLYSKNDEYLSLHSAELQIKTISQIQKVNKYSNLFDIDLCSFYKKSDNILKRIKKTVQAESEFDMLLYRVVRTKQDVYDIISSGFHRTKQWYQLPHGMEMKSSWNLLWTWSRPQIDITDLFIFQKVNHFFGNKQIARKDLLKKNIEKIKKMSKKLAILFDIIPETYFLPGQNLAFIKKFREYSLKQKLNLWILKPVGLSRGRGIQLVDKLQDVVFSQPIVLQKYLERPLLIEQRKFDMRIYVLVCSINPLEAYIYKQGFARLSTQKYTTEQEGLSNKFIHLTNYSVQKQNTEVNEKQNKTFQQTVGGPKITLKILKQKLLKIGVQWKNIQKQIEQIVLKSLIACMNSIPQNPNCFQLFGYDIIIDEQLKCWLLEVNSSPSLEKDFIIDQILKQQLIDDVIQVVQPIKYDRQRLKIIVERRRKQSQGLKSHVNFQNNSSQQLNQDLNYILHGAKLKKYGQISQNKNFKCVAPGQMYSSIVKAVQQTRIDPIIKNQNLYLLS